MKIKFKRDTTEIEMMGMPKSAAEIIAVGIAVAIIVSVIV